ncbi:hypothetical protein ACFFX1_34510 [Dactylosporangium sucinum]|uniref:hypothetical protein n=1 Tax=Dactylosporangium sucinum TaxID=1424081 RepID=UPI00167EAA34|nr:hypothetical protein [Dactylosporangium sucinum]
MLLLTAGCGDDAPEAKDNPYAAEFRIARERATSDFEKKVLADSDITKAEFDEAVQRYVRCAKDRGVDITPIPVGGYYNYETVKTDNAEAVIAECRAGTIAVLEPLYVDRLMNPQKRDIFELQVECLKKSGVVPADYTVQQLKADKENQFAGAPFSPDDAKFSACMANPNLG